jgi:ABC-type Fe3+/spermidine/putrescine transport system ATPase subunit
MSDRIAVMDGGHIVQEGTPQDVYRDPADEFVASFIGSTNLFTGTHEGPSPANPGHIRIKTDFGMIEAEGGADLDPTKPIIVAIRPEDVILHRDGTTGTGGLNRFEAKVGIGLFTGNAVEYYFDLADTLLQARTGSRHPLKRGDAIGIELPADALRTFSLKGEPKVRIGSRRLATLARVDDDSAG